MRTHAVALGLVASLILVDSALAQDICKAFLEKPVFTSTTVQTSANSKEDFRLLQCSASWKSAQDVQKAGISTEIPIYDIPVPIEANWSQDKVEAWKNSHCSAEERNSRYDLQLYKAVYQVDPISAKAALECVQTMVQGQEMRALRCSITESKSAIMFSAEWRRSPGEDLATGPVVSSFVALNTDCLNADAFKKGEKVSEGGVSVMCTVQQEAAAFSLNTNRGQCTAAATPRLPKVVLPAILTLGSNFYLSADEVEMPAGMKVVTNGNPFEIRAKTLTILGPGNILSFENVSPQIGVPGSSANLVKITASDVLGGGLSILNAGAPGGPGDQGAQGPRGAPGGPGTDRQPKWQKKACGPLAPICGLVPAGCEGGKSGGNGGPGGQGYSGNPGAPGGSAGEVSIDVPIEAREQIKILTDISIYGQSQACDGKVCGGKGGAGGPGGPGGPGGDGGKGADRTAYCGGTSNGKYGPAGPEGPVGPAGPDGQNALAIYR